MIARRLAAILAADVVGYSRLMAVDEARTHARLKVLRKDFIEQAFARQAIEVERSEPFGYATLRFVHQLRAGTIRLFL